MFGMQCMEVETGCYTGIQGVTDVDADFFFFNHLLHINEYHSETTHEFHANHVNASKIE